MQPPKKKSNLSNGDTVVTQPTIHLEPERRKQLMASINMVEIASEEHEPEWTWDGFEYSPTEDLLNIKVPEAYKETVCDANGARLIIHSIMVDNFKSYKGEHQLGPLHKNLTMILGPNGSGKSNVIDALLFVFGFKSAKIRTKKLTSLIHSDGECNYCKVEINYQMIKDIDEEKYTVIPESSFKISRSVHKDGFSQYKINETVSTLKDVHELLKRAGIDMTHNRFLILQGEVEAIALMRPTVRNASAGEEGMLEYIEDIVGTNRFVEPIAKLAHRVRLLEMRASQFGVGVRRHALQLDQFQPTLDASIAYINALNHNTFLSIKLGKSAKAKLIKRKEEAIANRVNHKHLYEDKFEVWKEAKESLNKAENKEKRLMSSLQETAGRIQSKEAELAEWQMADAKRKASLKSATREFAKLVKESEELKKEKDAAAAVPDKARAAIAQIRPEIQTLLNNEANAQHAADEGLIKFENKSKDEKEKHRRLAEEYAKKNELSIKVSSELAVLTSDLSEMKVTAGQGQKRLAELKEALEQATKQCKADQNELDEKSLEVINVSNEVEKAKNEIQPLEVVERDLMSRKYHLERDMVSLEHEKVYSSTKRTTTKLFEELKAAGKFDGYIGRLGDLGYCDKKYDATISSNFGQMEHYVMKTGKDVEWAIDYMKKNKIGRINCIDLETVQRDHYILPRNKMPAERLIEQIQCEDPEIMKVFQWAIQDTLVVETLNDIARVDRHARGNDLKICTMDGTIRDRNGNYNGGGMPLTGRIRTGNPVLVEEKKISAAKTKKQLDNICRSLESTSNKISVLKEIVSNGAPRLRSLQSRCTELKEAIPMNTARIATLKKAISEQEKRVANPRFEVSEEELAKKRALAEKLKKQSAALSKDAESAKKLVDGVQKKLDQMFNQFVEKSKLNAKELRSRIEKLEKEAAKEEAAIEAAPGHVEALQKRIEEHDTLMMTKRIEVDVLSSLEGEADTKLVVEMHQTLQTARLQYKSCENQLTKVKKVRENRATVEREAEALMLEYKVVYDRLEEIIEELDKLIQEEDVKLEELEEKWIEIEDLDPHTSFVRVDDELFEEKISAGALMIPSDILGKLDKYKEESEALQDVVLSDQETHESAEEIVQLEKAATTFRVKHDEKGITHYATLRALQATEEYDFSKYSDSVALHRAKLQELRAARLKEFQEALTFLGTTTQMLYQLLTNGGDASLKFVEEGRSSDPFEAGVKFSVRPAKKSWKLIENLSGGEKTLASLCFVFAMHHYRATPLYVMDEIDAALDLNNVRLIANYIKHSERTSNAQFIIVSLRNQMFEVGNRLIGIYKTFGCTHNVVIAPERVENGNKQLKTTLDEKIREETKKKNAEKEADEEEIVEGVKHLKIKRRRKLCRLLLSDFGLPENDEENAPPPSTSASISDSPTVTPPPPVRRALLDDDSPEEEEEDEQPIALKRRHQVAKEFDQESDSPSPPPERVRKPARGRRAAGRK